MPFRIRKVNGWGESWMTGWFAAMPDFGSEQDAMLFDKQNVVLDILADCKFHGGQGERFEIQWRDPQSGVNEWRQST